MKFLHNDTSSKKFRQKLRHDQTSAESLLWYKLRNRQLNSWKFYRQFSVGPYILDFYSEEIHLGIEVDGGQHNEEANKVRDEKRTAYLNKYGLKVIRFWDNEVLTNIEGVLEVISNVRSNAP